jgi:hypothetical protein
MTKIPKPNENELLMMKALDNELDEKEEIRFNQLISENEQFKMEWKSFQKMKNISKSIPFKNIEPEDWDIYWQKIYNKIERKAAWVFLIFGFVIVAAFGFYHFLQELFFHSEINLFLKIAIISFIIGVFILFISVVRERLTLRKTDKYKDIIR